MADKKLFHVTLEVSYYAYAEDSHEAEGYADEAMRDGMVEPWATEVKYRELPRDNWARDSLVYTDRAEGDTELGTLLDKLPEPPPKPIRAAAS